MWEENGYPTYKSELIDARLSINFFTFSIHLYEDPFLLDYINASFLKCDDKSLKN